MDFRYPPAAETFRAEVRAWLAAHLDRSLAGFSLRDELTPALVERLRAWNRKLADARLAGVAWPEAYGGRGASVLEEVVLAEEMARADAPGPLNPIGLSNIAPAILQFGTERQKSELLPRMLRGDDLWCQGFSEPDAGSDLAAVRTRAVRDGADFVVDGQKVWTTLGPFADWCELLVRTDPEARPHEGLSILLVDMKRPGIEVRPLRTITGQSDFSEIFFTGVRVPADTLLGPLHGGWRVAMATLAHERAGVATLHLGVRKKIARLLREAGPARDPATRRALARTWMLGELMRLQSQRALSAAVAGVPAGPEGSLVKLTWSLVEDAVAAAAGDVLGAAANAGDWGTERVWVRAASIAGGTTQVNKNIVAARLLALPRSRG
jgi:alkylation response protein AidB-like acyl-CoA dehydrogenase